MAKLVSLNDTFLKARPDQSSTLQPRELIKFPKGKTLAIADNAIFEDKGGHFKVLFSPLITITLGGIKSQMAEGYIYGSHWSGISAVFKAKTEAASRFSAAGSSIVLQPTPLLIQNDNKDWADDGSASNLRYGGVQCGLSSTAMLVASIWPNAKVKQLAGSAEGGQFENWIAGQFKRIGAQSTAMEGHVAVLKELGIKAVARRNATIADVKQALHKHPVITGMAFRSSGHFVCSVGVADAPGDLPDKWPVGKIDQLIAYPQDIDKAGVIFNCPYGHRDFSGSGNNWFDIARNMTDTFGLHNVATNDILERFWVDGGEESGWAVFVDPSTPNAGNDKEPPVQLAATAKPAAAASTPKSEAIGGMMKIDDAMVMAIPNGCSRITPLRQTLLKASPVPSSELTEAQKDSFDMDEAIVGVISAGPGGHCLVTLPGAAQIKGRNTWYLFRDHVKIETPGGTGLKSPGAKVTEADYDRVAKMIGCESRALKTVVMVEAAGGGFLPSGRPKILFEAHWFSDFTKSKYDSSSPNISSRKWNPDLYDGGELEWDRMEAAMKLNRSFAIQSASYGLPQIMGAYANEMPGLGFKDEEDFLERMSRSEGDQLEAMGRFIMLDPRLVSAIKSKSWAKFAEAYNGESYYVNKYDQKLQDAYDSLG
jgi:N-acetylmuramidase